MIDAGDDPGDFGEPFFHYVMQAGAWKTALEKLYGGYGENNIAKKTQSDEKHIVVESIIMSACQYPSSRGSLTDRQDNSCNNYTWIVPAK